MVELSSRSEGSRGEGEVDSPHQLVSQGIEPGTSESAARDDTPEPLAPQAEVESGNYQAVDVDAVPSVVLNGIGVYSIVYRKISYRAAVHRQKHVTAILKLGSYASLPLHGGGVRYRVSKGIGIGERYRVLNGTYRYLSTVSCIERY